MTSPVASTRICCTSRRRLAARAEGIVVPAAALDETVAAYDADVSAGVDHRCGRGGLAQGCGALRRIESPPFCACPSTSAIIATWRGLTVDPQMRVVDALGDVIPGLFAACEVTGGFHGVAFETGTAVGQSSVRGRLAGRNAAPARASRGRASIR